MTKHFTVIPEKHVEEKRIKFKYTYLLLLKNDAGHNKISVLAVPISFNTEIRDFLKLIFS